MPSTPADLIARVELQAALSHLIAHMPSHYGITRRESADFHSEPAVVIAQAVLASELASSRSNDDEVVRSLDSLLACLAALRHSVPETFIDLRTGTTRRAADMWSVKNADRLIKKFSARSVEGRAA